jgi:hypothetical protein
VSPELRIDTAGLSVQDASAKLIEYAESCFRPSGEGVRQQG